MRMNVEYNGTTYILGYSKIRIGEDRIYCLSYENRSFQASDLETAIAGFKTFIDEKLGVLKKR